MLRWDRHLESWVVGHRASVLDPVFRWLTYAGTDGAIWLAIAATLALSSRRTRLLILVACADLAADVSTLGLQAAVGRDRPHVHRLVALPHSSSFPSGHAATSFACATAIAILTPKLRTAAFVLAALIAWSRVYVGVHYPLDVVAGAVWGIAIGIATVTIATRIRKGRTPQQPERRT